MKPDLVILTESNGGAVATMLPATWRRIGRGPSVGKCIAPLPDVAVGLGVSADEAAAIERRAADLGLAVERRAALGEGER